MKILSPSVVSSAVKQQHISSKSVAMRNRHIRKVSVIVVTLAVFAIVFVWIRIEVVTLGYEVSKIHYNIEKLEKKRSHLEVKVAQLKAPARLEKIASKYFSMALPKGSAIEFVKVD
ncbi:MAG: cell division protein FtsL [Deltaproteobacteria bacterium CG_4_10_14_0_2_um_filter_43_8]|nr:MAG: cell division protein FtsL [Deltaproteobacteria bacterium CG11_big_fil_rev_8_21_14_0_20_42_23]PJA18362.1 MAG: cell division protein FtsL [Deltaproteobacteria bacterium CG_4_10_14_0_2_um_filter_43_8]PJC65105.1 MAG: cell division protein FtsL [Deltaproteobacteria bacterium CG_4_9_14_0_2_um_filter_42_21]